jgi:hypothetical protein
LFPGGEGGTSGYVEIRNVRRQINLFCVLHITRPYLMNEKAQSPVCSVDTNDGGGGGSGDLC